LNLTRAVKDAILREFVREVERDERIAVTKRVDLMLGELKYLTEHKAEEVRKAQRFGWTRRKLEVLFVLNSFYQRIVRPLLASSEPPRVLGKRIPIRYGQKILFDEEKNKANLKMSLTFLALCERLGVSRRLLEAQKTNDLIWIINTSNDGREGK